MFKKFFDAIRSFFTSFFPASDDKKTTKPKPSTKEDLPDIPQDGSEIKKDTIVIVANEMDKVIIDPSSPDKEFDDDIFEEPTTETEEPSPEPEVEESPLGESISDPEKNIKLDLDLNVNHRS